jgi:two-component system, NarL family, nitrate/nitrite response regulator NarL
MSTASSMPDTSAPIRVLLVEDHEHVLWGLRKLIEGEWPRMSVVGTARTVLQAFDAIDAERPDVVVLDPLLLEDNTLDYLPRIQSGGAAIVVLTGWRNPELHRQAVEAGARTVVLKEEPAEVLLREIVRAHEWRRSRCDRVARQEDCQSAVGAGIAGFVFFNDTEMKS